MRSVTEADDPGQAARYWSSLYGKPTSIKERTVRCDLTGAIYDSGDDTEADVISAWTPEGPVVIRVGTVADCTLLLDAVLTAASRLARSGRIIGDQ